MKNPMKLKNMKNPKNTLKRFGKEDDEDSAGYAPSAKGGMAHTPAPDRRRGQRQVKV